MSQYTDQIRERLIISSVISRYIGLKPRGNGEYFGICPFHKEKTPSFTVSDHKQFYHCFGCGAHGDIISFIQNYLNIDYREALEKLATEAGIELPKTSSQNVETDEKFEIYHKILEYLVHIYQSNLYSKDGKDALIYLKYRGLSDEMIKRYHLGYATNNNAIVLNILQKHFSIEDILESGALRKSNESTKIYNHFAGRIIFPIFNKNGRAIGFGGRLLENEQMQQNHNNTPYHAKYINSSDSEIFTKGLNLYGLNIAQAWFKSNKQISKFADSHMQSNMNNILTYDVVQNLIKTQTIIVVEGYLDVIALAAQGLENSVAPLGTAIKIEQIQLLWKYSKNPIICLDNDLAGKRAMYRIAENILPYINSQNTLRFLQIDDAKDPADFVQKNGIQKFLYLIANNTIGLANFIFQEIINEVDTIETPEAKAELHRKLMIMASNIQNQQLRHEYGRHFNKLYNNFLYTKEQTFRKKQSYLSNYKTNENRKFKYNQYNKEKIEDSKTTLEKKILQNKILTETTKDISNNFFALKIGNSDNKIFIPYQILNAVYLTIRFPYILQHNNTISKLISELQLEEEILKIWQFFIAWYNERHASLGIALQNREMGATYNINQIISEITNVYDAITVDRIAQMAELLEALERSSCHIQLIKYFNNLGQDLQNDINIEKIINIAVQSLQSYKNYDLQKQIDTTEAALLQESVKNKENYTTHIVSDETKRLYEKLVTLKRNQTALLTAVKDQYGL